MHLTSPVFEQQGIIPKKYTCQGKNTNPPLEISGVPSGAKSLVLIMDDPDVPKTIREDGMYVHWVVFNIDPSKHVIDEDTAPFGIVGRNTGGKNAYTGPCPPDREHRYFFKLYALDTKLDLPAGATKEEVLEAIEGHVLAEAVLMGRYEKVGRV